MNQHNIGHYLDGRRWIPYCKNCSAEGEDLLSECKGYISSPAILVELTKEEFLKKLPTKT